MPFFAAKSPDFIEMKISQPALKDFDAAEYLDSPEAIAAYLTDALATNDQAQISQALGTAARAAGMSNIAKTAKLGRESLYKALASNGNPSFGTVLKVLSALGVRLTAEVV
jgi:probable addiction module antidote protein